MFDRLQSSTKRVSFFLILAAFFFSLYLDGIGINKSMHATIFFAFLQCLTIFENRFSCLLRAAIAILLALCICMSYACHSVYSEGFNIAFAASMLNSNATEVRLMSGLFSVFALVTVALFGLQYYSQAGFKRLFGGKHHAVTGVLVIYALSSVVYIAEEEDKFGVEKSRAASYLERTPFYNLSFFLRAWDEQSKLKAMANLKFTHSYRAIAPAYEEVVVVVGESARRDKLHAYGYPRETSPMLDSQLQANATLFANAVAPAPYTLLAVPLTLTTAKNDTKETARIFDSVLDVANDNGIDTRWISIQGNWGDDESGVAAIASRSRAVQWVRGGDENVIAPLEKALAKPGRKLIFVHINGSHEPVCARLPNASYLFGRQTEDDCYDSTIRYTDTLLGKVFNMLSGHNAAVVYYSDHGLVKNNRGNYVHASGLPPKEAVEVPMMVWFAHGRPAGIKPRITAEYSTAYNYYLIADLLGLEVDGKRCLSALNRCYDFSRPAVVTDTSGGDHLYSSLPD